MRNAKLFLLLGCLSGLFVAIGWGLGRSTGAIAALILAAVMNFASYYLSDRMVLAMYRAREVSDDTEPRLLSAVRSLANASDMPMPKVYVMDQDAPNAFATGRNPQHSAVAVTTGLMRICTDDEIRGVIAHELAHIRNRDILIGTMAATIAGAISMIGNMLQWGFMLGGMSGGGDDGEEGNGAFGLIASIVLSIVASFAAMMIQMAISRSREFVADETGARMAGNPYGLANALRKLEAASERDMQSTPATAHLFIVAPLSGAKMSRLFSTHPPTAERIARLENMRLETVL